MVIWLLGISGAGKTTLGKKLKNYYDSKDMKSCIIDGDIVRDFYDNDLGYNREDRIANIKRIMLAVYLLEQNGIVPIVCNISPFEFLRDFARKKFIDYQEIYLKKDINIAKENDIKDVYKKNINKTSIVGIDMQFEEPQKSSLVLDTTKESIEESFDKLINHIKSLK